MFQVSAALRPAFSTETPSDVTAAACDVSMWLVTGCQSHINKTWDIKHQ